MFGNDNEIYGELYYYSVVELLKHLKIAPTDHFLDIGSGLGKLVFQIFITTDALSVSGVEINEKRHLIACKIKEKIEQHLPELFSHRTVDLVYGDFLKQNFDKISIIYLCNTVFSEELLQKMGCKINTMTNVKTIVSLRKLPNLTHFKITKRFFLHTTWDRILCYLYSRIPDNG